MKELKQFQMEQVQKCQQTKQYIGDTEGVKFWNWSNGALITYNSQEGSNANELSGALGFYAIKELIKTGNSEKIDGYTVYKLDGSELSDSVKTNENGEFYCIHLVNDTTHDNIVICCKDKNIAIHMAKSIQYKTGNSISHDNNAVNSSTNSPSKTFPVYADDGTLIGYFAPGSIVHPSPNDDSYIVNSDGSLSLYSRGNDYYDNSSDDQMKIQTSVQILIVIMVAVIPQIHPQKQSLIQHQILIKSISPLNHHFLFKSTHLLIDISN